MNARAGRPPGFTLVEVLVALTVMAVIAALSWRGVDGMLRSREGTTASLDRTTRLNTVLVQWEQDLQAIADTGSVVPPMAFEQQTLRLTRLVSAADGTDVGVQMVVWALRGGVWMRWAGTPVTRAEALQQQWLASQQLQGNEREQVRLLDGVEELQLYVYVDGRKTNPQSSRERTASGQREQLPGGVQLVIKLGGGTLTRDVAVVTRS